MDKWRQEYARDTLKCSRFHTQKADLNAVKKLHAIREPHQKDEARRYDRTAPEAG